ncbi:glutathione s-transferase [Stylonychia lemnae]|uniref:Glutathione s-transferase n=1 Tax=Stylonychia lemnae TaxID=5949 RepID=A0A077ZT95_STYLE|nr:glutathione s-transferase [Stylonychia lemnae]|eukprot:CDW71686.1 glutathione s-transferase [Stylonychia lemnae]
MSIKVHYFEGYGKAEAIRMLLAHAKADWESVNYDDEQFKALKESGKLEFGQVPVLEREGKLYSQSQAILRGLGIAHGYYPSDPYHAYLADSMLDYLSDFSSARVKALYYHDPEAKEKMIADFIAKNVPALFEAIQKRLEENSCPDKLVGEKLTIADFGVASISFSQFMNKQNVYYEQYQEILSKYPKVLDYFNGLGEVLKEHLETRKPSPY